MKYDDERRDRDPACVARIAHGGDRYISCAVSHRQSVRRHPAVLLSYHRLRARGAAANGAEDQLLRDRNPGRLYAVWPVRAELFRDFLARAQDCGWADCRE